MKDTLKDLWNGNLEPWSEEWEREREARELPSACRGQPPLRDIVSQCALFVPLFVGAIHESPEK